jgi:hypothetical protein
MGRKVRGVAGERTERDTSRTTHLQSSSLGFYARDLLRIALCTSSLAPSSRLLSLEALCRLEGPRELLMGIVELVLHSVLANADTASTPSASLADASEPSLFLLGMVMCICTEMLLSREKNKKLV